MCGNEQVVVFATTNVQFENVSFFINVSDEEKFFIWHIYEKANIFINVSDEEKFLLF